jgi:hypothetical protein
MTTWEMVAETIANPATWLALVVTGLGMALWLARERLVCLQHFFAALVQASQKELGFERLNQLIVGSVQRLAAALCCTQTGQLNWNIAGITGGLVLLLSILLWSMR